MAVDTVLASVLASSVVAALVTGFQTGRNERRRQLREWQMVLAGDFAGDAMAALAHLRRYKPTTRTGHDNEPLHRDPGLRRERARVAAEAIDALRPLRGRVWVAFPGRSPQGTPAKTASDWAEAVVAWLREVQQACDGFWRACEEEPAARAAHERAWNAKYQEAKKQAWGAVDGFATRASREVLR